MPRNHGSLPGVLHFSTALTRASLLDRRLHSERLDQNLEVIFRLLGLCYPPRDIYSAYYGIVSSRKEVRASGVEFLDNVLGKDLKSYLMPFLDPISSETTILKGQKLFGLSVKGRQEALASLILGRDPCLRACAIYNVTPMDPPDLVKLVEQARSDQDPLIRETAERVLHNTG